jgi:hypothetical protein
MDAQDAKRHAFEAGLSDSLRAAFRNAAEATAADGELMFPYSVSRDLAKAVACRNYAMLILQLCHLVNIADANGEDGWEVLFFSGKRASSSAFRGLVAKRLERRGWRRAGFEVTTEGIVISYEDGRFNVPFARMPVLAALMYFLLETVGYKAADDAFSQMLKKATRQQAVSKAANQISRQLYEYLGDHLRAAQEQGKFEQIVSYLSEVNGGGEAEISDAVILSFWCVQTEANEDNDFKQYRSALRAFVAFVKAIEGGKSKGAVARPASIGQDRNAGEISPDILTADMELEGEWQSPLPLLESEPASRIRFLNNREQKDVSLLMDWGPLAMAWPLSLLRYETFGFTQSRLTQAARSGTVGAEIDKIASCTDTENFIRRVERIGELGAHASETLKASAWILHQAAHDEADSEDDTVIDAHMLAARRAFKKLNRRGFDEVVQSNSDLIVGHRTGMEVMLSVRDRLAAWHEMASEIDASPPGLEGQFEADTECFKDGFHRLYGESG